MTRPSTHNGELVSAKRAGQSRAKRKPGRPSKYSAALVERICERLETGEPMAQMCREVKMPAARTVRDWIEHRPDVSAAIARAREIGFDAIAAETLEIADDSRNDWMERMAEGGDEKALQFNGEHVQRARLRVDTRLKLLAKWDPKRYGDKVQHSNDPDNPLPAPQFIIQPVRPAERDA